MQRNESLQIRNKSVLSKWVERFVSLGVPNELLFASFAANFPLPDLNLLYMEMTKLKQKLPHLSVTAPCQLHLLSKDLQWIQLSLTEQQAQTFKDDRGSNLLHYAALSGAPNVIASMLESHPHWVDSKDKYHANLLHYAGWSGDPHTMAWVLEHYPSLTESRSINGANLLHYAALSGEPEAMVWVLEHFPQWVRSKNDKGTNLLHYAALSGNPAAMAWVLKHYPKLLKSKDDNGLNLLHFAARSGSIPAIEWVLLHYPPFLMSRDYSDTNLLHYIADSGNASTFRWTLMTYPHQSAEWWVQDSHGFTPDVYAMDRNMHPTPRQILHSLFQEAIENRVAGKPSHHDIPILDAFHHLLIPYLVSDQENVPSRTVLTLLDNEPSKSRLRGRLMAIRTFLQLKSIEVEGQPLTLGLLQQLIERATEALIPGKDSPLILALQRLAYYTSQYTTQDLPPDVIKTLVLIIEDTQRNAPEFATKQIDQYLVTALFKTATLAPLRPKPGKEQTVEITTANYLEHALHMERQVAAMGLSAETKRILQTSFLPGLRHLITQQDQIVAHVSTRYGVLYDLAPNLPLHTDHTDPQQPEAYRETLNRLIVDVIAAFYIAERSGKLAGFFDKLADGYCFEGRVRDTLSWVVAYSGVKPFHEFMGSAYDQYCAYQKAMHGKLDHEVTFLTSATDFIATRYRGTPCLPHATYAPQGDITRESIERYLKEVLELDDEPMHNRSEKAQVLAKLDHHLSQAKSRQADSLLALRQAIAHADQPLDEVVGRWKDRPSTVTHKTHGQVIAEQPFRLFSGSQPTAAQKFIESLQCRKK